MLDIAMLLLGIGLFAASAAYAYACEAVQPSSDLPLITAQSRCHQDSSRCRAGSRTALFRLRAMWF